VGRARVVWYNVLYLPPVLARELPLAEHPRLRVVGEIADFPVQGAWIPAGGGTWYFIVSPDVLRATETRLGDVVEMRFAIDDQDRVDVPDALRLAIAANAAATRVWEALTPGKRRGLAYRVQSARSDAVRQKRIDEVLGLLLDPAASLARRR
jgi:hypothetical protein